MPTSDKNKSGGHSHPQKDSKSSNEQGDSRKSASPATTATSADSKKGERVKESFGKSGAKDSH